MITHKIETTAWLTSYSSASPEDLLSGKNLLDLSYCSHDMSHHGYTKVGIAKIDVVLMDKDEMVGNKVDALKAELQASRAAAALTEKRIMGQIQSLLAITNEVSA